MLRIHPNASRSSVWPMSTQGGSDVLLRHHIFEPCSGHIMTPRGLPFTSSFPQASACKPLGRPLCFKEEVAVAIGHQSWPHTPCPLMPTPVQQMDVNLWGESRMTLLVGSLLHFEGMNVSTVWDYVWPRAWILRVETALHRVSNSFCGL